MVVVGIEMATVEQDLLGGRLSCPCCSAALLPFGHGVEREVRLFKRSERRTANSGADCFR